MGTFQRFEDLEAWQEARVLAREIYSLTSHAPFARDFALRDQLRKAVISVASNIAEGFERRTPRSFLHFLSIAKASTAEVKTQLYLSLDIGYLSAEQFDAISAQTNRVSRLIHGLSAYLERDRADG